MLFYITDGKWFVETINQIKYFSTRSNVHADLIKSILPKNVHNFNTRVKSLREQTWRVFKNRELRNYYHTS